MTIVLKHSDIDFSTATPVVSDAMKFILPVPSDKGEALAYPETVTDAEGRVHQKGEALPLLGDGVIVFNSSEKIYQGAVRGGEGDNRAVIIINHVTEDKAALLTDRLNSLADGNPSTLVFDKFKQLEAYARSLGLTNMYDSTVGFVRENMQDVYTGATGADASPYGFKKRDARDRVLAVRVPQAGELVQPDMQSLPFDVGSVILQHGGDFRVITPGDFQKTYRKAGDFSPITVNSVYTIVTAGGMVIDPRIAERIARVAAQTATRLGIVDQPDSAVHHLGYVIRGGHNIPVHMRHAVDAVVMDRTGNVLLIERAHNPGAGKLALPGGFLDPAKHGAAENVAAATLRKLAEETGLTLPAHIRAVSLGSRESFRPFDVRQAFRDMPDVGITKGDFFAVTTKAYAYLVDDLSALSLKAGDDARKIVIRNVDDLKSDELGIDDHGKFIAGAAKTLNHRAASAENTQRVDTSAEGPSRLVRVLQALRLIR